MNKVLILFAHPAKSKSIMNKALRQSVEDLENVMIHDLYETYPDFMIDVKKEQKLLEESDVIVLQYPFYWYQAPSIIKEYLDLVLEHDWAYGSKGNALKGKKFTMSITAGGSKESYQKDGYNKYTIRELISPLIATANLCKMEFVDPFLVLGIHRGLPSKDVRITGEEYRDFVVALRESGDE